MLFDPNYNGYIPSNDFQLFSLPQFGDLFANSLGLSNRFSASDPSSFVNYSLNSFAQILKPQVQTAAPSTPNYGQGFELGNVGDLFALPDLVTPVFPGFQGQGNPPTIIMNPAARTPDQLKPIDPNRTNIEINIDPYGSRYPFPDTAGKTPLPAPTASQGKCPNGQSEYKDIFGFTHCGASMVSDGSGGGDQRVIGNDPTKSGDKAQTIADFFKTLPEGSGIFLIAIAIIILILLFARGR